MVNYEEAKKIALESLGEMAIHINEAFENFKEEQSYLLQKDYDKVIAIQTVSNAIINLKLKGDK